MNKAYMGYSFMLLSAASFALSSLLAIMAYETMSVPAVMLIQSVFAQAILAVMLWAERTRVPRGAQPSPEPRSPLAVSRLELAIFALAGGGATIAMFFAFAYLSLSLGTILLFTYPAFVTLLAWAVLGQRPGGRHFVALFLSLIGALLTTNLHGADPTGSSALGIGLALLAAAFNGLYIVMGERVAPAVSAVAAITMTRTVILTAALLLSAGVWAELPLIPREGWLITLLSSVVGGVAAFLFLQRGIMLIGANRAAIVSVAELPIALMLGWLVQGDVILPMQWVGTILVGAAVLISQWE